MEAFITNELIKKILLKLKEIEDPAKQRKYLINVMGMSKFNNAKKCVDLGDVPVHCEVYEHSKEAPVIIFIPGIGTYSEMYCEFLCKFSEWGFNVISVDLRGHGYSGGERGLYTVEDVQEDISLVISHFSKVYNDKIGLFGCSIGSPLALAAAESDSRVKALLCHTLFLTEHPPDLIHWIGWNSLGLTSAFIPFMKVDFRQFIDIEKLVENNAFAPFIKFDDLIVWQYPVKTLSSVYRRKCRVLNEKFAFNAAIIVGSRDEILSLSYERSIVSEMQHPFDILEIEGAGHMLPFERVKDTIIKASDWFNNNL
jgi:pimeloyl-ACP methyl ester carboxylesterase